METSSQEKKVFLTHRGLGMNSMSHLLGSRIHQLFLLRDLIMDEEEEFVDVY